MKRILAILLALAMAFPLCACMSPRKDNKLTADNVAGEWSSNKVDGLEAVLAGLEDGGDESITEMLSYIEHDPFSLVIMLTLNSDGSFLATTDKDTLRDSCDVLTQQLKIGMSHYLDAVVIESIEQSGYTEAQYREHLGLSDGDDLKEALEIDLDAVFAELGLDLLYERIKDKIDVAGTYMVEGDELTLFTDEGQVYGQIDDVANTITITSDGAGDAFSLLRGPLTFAMIES